MGELLRKVRYFLDDIPTYTRNGVYRVQALPKRVKLYGIVGILGVLIIGGILLAIIKTTGVTEGERYTGNGKVEFIYSSGFTFNKGVLELDKSTVKVIHDIDKELYYKVDSDNLIESSLTGSNTGLKEIHTLPTATTSITYEELNKKSSKLEVPDGLVEALEGNIVLGTYNDGVNYVKGLLSNGYKGVRYSASSEYHEFVVKDRKGNHYKIILTGEYIIRGSIAKDYIRGTDEAEGEYLKTYYNQSGVSGKTKE